MAVWYGDGIIRSLDKFQMNWYKKYKSNSRDWLLVLTLWIEYCSVRHWWLISILVRFLLSFIIWEGKNRVQTEAEMFILEMKKAKEVRYVRRVQEWAIYKIWDENFLYVLGIKESCWKISLKFSARSGTSFREIRSRSSKLLLFLRLVSPKSAF